MDLYEGSDFYLDLGWLYAENLNMTFLTFFYGVAMPILFPMGIFQMVNQRLCQKLRVAYICKLPPLMNSQLSDEVLIFLKYAPLVLLLHGFWIMDNQQMFDTRWSYIDKTYKPMNSRHYFTDLHFNQSTPLAYCLFFCTSMIFILKVVPLETLNYYGFGMFKHMLKVHEGLPKFKNSMPPENLNRITILRNHINQQYGFEFLENLFIDELKGGKMTSRKLQNDPFYNI